MQTYISTLESSREYKYVEVMKVQNRGKKRTKDKLKYATSLPDC